MPLVDRFNWLVGKRKSWPGTLEHLTQQPIDLAYGMACKTGLTAATGIHIRRSLGVIEIGIYNTATTYERLLVPVPNMR